MALKNKIKQLEDIVSKETETEVKPVNVIETRTFEDLEPDEGPIHEIPLVSVGPIEQVNMREREEYQRQRSRSVRHTEQKVGRGRGQPFRGREQSGGQSGSHGHQPWKPHQKGRGNHEQQERHYDREQARPEEDHFDTPQRRDVQNSRYKKEAWTEN